MKLGFHLMTFGGWAKKQNVTLDLDEAFAHIKRAGYDAVELGGSDKSLGTPESLKAKLSNAGLALAAFDTGVTANPWAPNVESYRREIDYAGAMEMKTLMVCGGFISGRRNMFDEDYKMFADNLATAQSYANQYGLQISYHPHLGCMVETAGEFDRILKLNPKLKLCIDTGHLIAVHTDPSVMATQHGDILTHIHLKDWSRKDNAFCEIGRGDAGLNFSQFFDTLKKVEYRGWVVVERDSPPIPAEESAKISRDYLRTLGI